MLTDRESSSIEGSSTNDLETRNNACSKLGGGTAGSPRVVKDLRNDKEYHCFKCGSDFALMETSTDTYTKITWTKIC